MTQPRDPDLIVAAWLEDGPDRLPRETRSAITVALRTQPRVRRRAVPGGNMLPLTKLATAAGIVLAVGLVGVLLFANRQSDVGSQPTVAPSASAAAVAAAPSVPTSTNTPPSPSPTAVSTAGWQTFTSNRYGYQIKYPPSLTPEPAARQWTDADASDWLSPGHDLFKSQPVGVTAFAVSLPPGTSRDSWITSYFAGPAGGASGQRCDHTVEQLPMTEVAGSPVVFWQESTGDCGGTYAFFVAGNRLYTFFIGREGYEPTLEAMLSTFQLTP